MRPILQELPREPEIFDAGQKYAIRIACNDGVLRWAQSENEAKQILFGFNDSRLEPVS